MPRDSDIVFDMRFLATPHWQAHVRLHTGRYPAVGGYVASDPAFADAFDRISGLTVSLIPSYRREGKSYLTIAVGCTGGRHRSVYVAERLAEALRAAGHSLNVVPRDMKGAREGTDKVSGQAPQSQGARHTACMVLYE